MRIGNYYPEVFWLLWLLHFWTKRKVVSSCNRWIQTTPDERCCAGDERHDVRMRRRGGGSRRICILLTFCSDIMMTSEPQVLKKKEQKVIISHSVMLKWSEGERLHLSPLEFVRRLSCSLRTSLYLLLPSETAIRKGKSRSRGGKKDVFLPSSPSSSSRGKYFFFFLYDHEVKKRGRRRWWSWHDL